MQNNSGIDPLEVHVLIKLEEVETVTKSGIITMTESQRKLEEKAGTRATLIDSGENSFVKWGRKPIAGDKVVCKKYAGLSVTGLDGEEYRVCEDLDIIATVKGK